MEQENVSILKFTIGEGDFDTIEKATQSLKDEQMVVVQFRGINEETETKYRKILEDVIIALDGSTNRISTDIHIFMPNGITAQPFEN